jgi:hypothetical protein
MLPFEVKLVFLFPNWHTTTKLHFSFIHVGLDLFLKKLKKTLEYAFFFSEERILIGGADFLSQFLKKDSGKNILDFCFLGDMCFFILLREKKIIDA